MQPYRGHPNSARGLRSGFTLIEAAITTVIIGVGIVAMLTLIASGTSANVETSELTTAVNLAKNVRERTLQQTFDTVKTLNGTTYSPPIDSRGIAISALSDWSQVVTVEIKDPNLLTATIVDATPDAVRVTATVLHNGKTIGGLSWHRFAATP